MALVAAILLEDKGIQAQVVDVPTIKPLQPAEITLHGARTGAAITIEDHSIYGGLGSAVAEIYAEHLQHRVHRIGIPDVFTESGTIQALRSAYGISVDSIVDLTIKVLDRKTDLEKERLKT
jgi:transketolase